MKEVTKLNRLTQSQQKLMHQVKDEWLQSFFGLEFDEKKAIEQWKWLYKFCKLKEPKVMVLDSPLAIQFTANLFNKMDQVRNQVGTQVGTQVRDQVWDQVGTQVRDQVGNQVRTQVRDQVGDQVRNQVGTQVRTQVRDQVGAQVRTQVWTQVRDQVRDQVGDQVGDQVRNQVRDQVWDQVGTQVGTQVRDQVWDQVRAQVGTQVGTQVRAQVRDQVGAQVRTQVWTQVRDQVWTQKMKYYVFGYYCDCSCKGWVAFYDFFERIGIVKNEDFMKYNELIKNSPFLTVQFDKLVLLSKPPVFINRDDRNRLHSTHDYAICFNDGFGLHYVNGVHFSNEDFDIYFKNKPTAEQVLSCKNTEQKTAIIQHYGIQYVYDKCDNLNVIDQYEEKSYIDNKPVKYELFDVDITDTSTSEAVKFRFVKVECHTEHKPTFLGVPVTIECGTVRKAVAWTYNMTESEYWDKLQIRS